MTKAVCLLSGGLDSATCLAMALEVHPNDVLAVSFDYGQRHRDQELHAGLLLAEHYKVNREIVNLQQLRFLLRGSALTDRTIQVPHGHYTDASMAVTVVPNRNAIMLSIAFGIARARGAKEVWAGMHAGDHAIYPDCRPEFVRKFNEMEFSANADLPDPPILVAPLQYVMKYDIVREGARRNVPYHLTYSCYEGKALHCGKCGTCVERIEAFQLAGVPDPTTYEIERGVTA